MSVIPEHDTIRAAVKEHITSVLGRYRKKVITDDTLKAAAVLVPLFAREKQYHVLYTQRSDEVNFHKGQVCFPGGTREESDSSLLATALREVQEEIGLNPEDVEVIGELDDITTVTSGYIISPFVGFIPYPYPFRVDRKEIRELFTVPLSALLDEGNFKHYSYEYEGHIIWGATAMISRRFAQLLRSESGAL